MVRRLSVVLVAAAILMAGYFLGWAADVAILDGPAVWAYVSGRVEAAAPVPTTTPPVLQPQS